MRAKTKGYVAQLKVATALLEKGFIVAFVEGDDSPYDLVADWKGKLSRIQAKSTNNLGDAKQYYYSYHVNVTKGNKRISQDKYTKRDCDFLAVIIPKTQHIYIIPVEEIQTVSINLYPDGQRQPQKNSRNYERFIQAWDLLR